MLSAALLRDQVADFDMPSRIPWKGDRNVIRERRIPLLRRRFGKRLRMLVAWRNLLETHSEMDPGEDAPVCIDRVQ